jgi:hypothetical protein
MGHAMQLGVNQGNQASESGLIAPAPCTQQVRDFGWFHRVSWIPSWDYTSTFGSNAWKVQTMVLLHRNAAYQSEGIRECGIDKRVNLLRYNPKHFA